MNQPLYPPLYMIENDLFGEPDDEPVVVASGDDEDASGTVSVSREMPAALRHLIERTVASEAAHGVKPLATGQIRCIVSVASARGPGRPLGRSCGVLLGAHMGGSRWSGWMAAQESAYACDRDLVLQEEDGPIHPDAAMIQTWNPVEVILRGDEPLLGELPGARLGVAGQLADWKSQGDDFVPSRPGRIGGWNLDENTVVFTGTPLGGTDDPRMVYQQLYARLAQELRVAATSPAVMQPVSPVKEVAPVGILAWIRRPLLSPAWGVAALTVVVVQAVWLSGAFDVSGSSEERYRGAGQGQARVNCLASVKVIIKPGASYADATLALSDAGATLFDGPTRNGEVWVIPSEGTPAQALAETLRQNPVVENADVVPPAGPGCKK